MVFIEFPGTRTCEMHAVCGKRLSSCLLVKQDIQTERDSKQGAMSDMICKILCVQITLSTYNS